MANDFCRFLSNGYRFESDGNNFLYKPCCWFHSSIDVADPDFFEKKKKISEIKDWTPDCSACQRIEKSGAYGAHSPRLRSFYTIEDGSIPDDVPAWIEFSIDVTCNAACIMCGPHNSTLWKRHQFKYGITGEMEQTTPASMRWEYIKDNFPLDHLRNAYFVGGEPFESEIPLQLLETMKLLLGDLRDFKIGFQTNGSIRPSARLLELAAECREVIFNFSIDGVGQRFEYVRYPLKWRKVDANVEYLKSLNLPNVKFYVLATINPANIFYYDEIEDWVKEKFGNSSSKFLVPNKCTGQIDLSQTPPLLREVLLDKFGADHPANRLLSNAGSTDPLNCVRYLQRLDGFRSTDWTQVFPDVVQYFVDQPKSAV